MRVLRREKPRATRNRPLWMPSCLRSTSLTERSQSLLDMSCIPNHQHENDRTPYVGCKDTFAAIERSVLRRVGAGSGGSNLSFIVIAIEDTDMGAL